jgi:glycosyltransferase involved in cell wall biosynthesis
MMKALGELGHEVGLATVVAPSPAATSGLHLRHETVLTLGHRQALPSALTPVQERFRSYWGVDQKWITALADAAEQVRADAVVAVGLTVLPYLAAIPRTLRVWYAADEWVWHHVSQVRVSDRRSWSNLSHAAIKGLYERAYAPVIDRAWVVSNAERRAMTLFAGVRAVDVLPNGVDSEHYQPAAADEIERSAIFWGRLDFGPNVQALEWFCTHVWPDVRRQQGDARFTIVGFNPSDAVRRLVKEDDGISLIPDLPDLRDAVRRHAVVVLPFVSGGGIKNKLLEAASLGKAIVGSRRACAGLLGGNPPLVCADKPAEWVRAIAALWGNADRRRTLGADARRWVVEQHTWAAAARGAVAGLERSLSQRSSR